jgi:hypothetical protein
MVRHAPSRIMPTTTRALNPRPPVPTTVRRALAVTAELSRTCSGPVSASVKEHDGTWTLTVKRAHKAAKKFSFRDQDFEVRVQPPGGALVFDSFDSIMAAGSEGIGTETAFAAPVRGATAAPRSAPLPALADGEPTRSAASASTLGSATATAAASASEDVDSRNPRDLVGRSDACLAAAQRRLRDAERSKVAATDEVTANVKAHEATDTEELVPKLHAWCGRLQACDSELSAAQEALEACEMASSNVMEACQLQDESVLRREEARIRREALAEPRLRCEEATVALKVAEEAEAIAEAELAARLCTLEQMST